MMTRNNSLAKKILASCPNGRWPVTALRARLEIADAIVAAGLLPFLADVAALILLRQGRIGTAVAAGLSAAVIWGDCGIVDAVGRRDAVKDAI
jgi:hypothetical protein